MTELETLLTQDVVDKLHRVARRRCFGTLEADDVVAAALERIASKFHLFKGDNFPAWAMTVMLNVLRNEIASRASKPEVSVFQDAAHEGWAGMIADTVDIERDTVARDTAARIVGALDPKHRTALVLHVAGYRHREIAEHMGIGVGTSCSLVRRAKAKAARIA